MERIYVIVANVTEVALFVAGAVAMIFAANFAL